MKSEDIEARLNQEFDAGMYPYQIVLGFRTQEEADYMMGQLSDGFGENEMYLRWPAGDDLKRTPVVGVELTAEHWELLKHHRAMRKKFGLSK